MWADVRAMCVLTKLRDEIEVVFKSELKTDRTVLSEAN